MTIDYCLGVDVSDIQGIIDWKKVKDSGISFAFCKATEGDSFVAKRFKTNWEEIKKNGLIRGAYHFAHTKNDPVIEANHFVKNVGELDSSDMLVLDIEDAKCTLNDEQFLIWTLKFLETVKQLANVTPIVYTGGPYFDKFGGSKPTDEWIKELSIYPLWLAAYSLVPDKYVPAIWKSVGWSIWQRSGDVAAKGDKVFRIPGINSVVDRNQYKGTVEGLEMFAKSLHHDVIKITPSYLLPIDLDLHKNVDVIDKTVDEPLPIPRTFFGNLLHKIFGTK